MMPIEAKFQSYVAFVARSRLQIPPDHATDMTVRAIRLRTSVTQNLFTRETCIKLENPFLWQFLTFILVSLESSRNVVFIKRFGSDAPYKGKLF